jgi:AcrR family transcriptional regulator
MRGERAGLSRDRVVAAAREVLEREGVDALTMRRVAAALGVAPNALYSHVADKGALLEAVMDAVLADVEIPARGPWRVRLERILAGTRRVLLGHPSLVPLFLARQSTGPNALRLGEAVLAQLHRAGLGDRDAARALQVLLVYTIGATAFEIPRRDDPDPTARARRAEARAGALDPDTHPQTTRVAADLSRHPADEVFATGLRWLLDGLAPP